MNLCSNGHDEVCFDGSECPCCEEMSTRDDTIDNLTDEVDELKDQVKELEEKNNEPE